MRKANIRCHLECPIMIPDRYIHLDGMLASVVAKKKNLPPALTPDEVLPIEIPIKKHDSGKFHLCSASIYEQETVDKKHIYKRFPIREIQDLSKDGQRKINRSRGHQKDYKIPKQVIWPKNGILDFRLIGDVEKVMELLIHITHVGKKRSSGMGSVSRWEAIEDVDWNSAIVDDQNNALRHLPGDIDANGPTKRSRATYPYWLAVDRETVIFPDF